MPKLSDDWREETQIQLKARYFYKILEERMLQHEADRHFIGIVDDAVYYAYQRTKTVMLHMREYTLHDGDHLFRVLHLMERLLPEGEAQNLSTPELGLLILAAFYHDIGMAPPEADVKAWKAIWDKREKGDVPPTQTQQDFWSYIRGRPEQLKSINHLLELEKHGQASMVQELLVSEYIRHTHAARARAILHEDWYEKIRYRDIDLTVELAELCDSHNKDPEHLLELESEILCGPGIYIRMPLLGVVLRLADLLDFDAKRTPDVLLSHLDVRHPVSLSEWAKHRSVAAWDIGPNRIAFRAICEHPAVESGIQKFCDYIDRELAACASILRRIGKPLSQDSPSFDLILASKVDRAQIKAKRDTFGNPLYRYHESRFSLSPSQVIDLLMGSALYEDPTSALRELIQNSLDACLTRKAMEQKWGNSYQPSIKVTFPKDSDDCLVVEDNGIGMDQEIVDQYYTRVGASFYKSEHFFRMCAEHDVDFQPISRFGIGILSCFLVANGLDVDTRRLLGPHESSKPVRIRIEGRDSIFWFTDGERQHPGTTTRLHLHRDHPWKVMSHTERIEATRKLIPNPPFPIEIISDTESSQHNSDSFTIQAAVLQRSSQSDYTYVRTSRSDHLRSLQLDLTRPFTGLAGHAEIWILEENDQPVVQKELFRRTVMIEDDYEEHELTTALKAKLNAVERISDSLEVDENSIGVNSGSSIEAGSSSSISVHGIEVPVELFPSRWRAQQRSSARIEFPFPCDLYIDVTGSRDLQLDVSRTRIIVNSEWHDLVRILSRVLIEQVRDAVSDTYWRNLSKIWKSIFKSERQASRIFINSLDEVLGNGK